MPIRNETQDSESLGEQIAYAEETLRLSVESLKVAEQLVAQARHAVLTNKAVLENLQDVLKKMPKL